MVDAGLEGIEAAPPEDSPEEPADEADPLAETTSKHELVVATSDLLAPSPELLAMVLTSPSPSELDSPPNDPLAIAVVVASLRVVGADVEASLHGAKLGAAEDGDSEFDIVSLDESEADAEASLEGAEAGVAEDTRLSFELAGAEEGADSIELEDGAEEEGADELIATLFCRPAGTAQWRSCEHV